jgi:Tol biopolymer transport system component
MFANYQTAKVDTSGNKVEVFRADHGNADSLHILMPTLGPNGMYAFIILEKTNRLGIGIAPVEKKTLTREEIGQGIKFMTAVTAPAWSPDGKWIAFIDTDMSRMGLYITNPDFTEKYLVFKPGPGQAVQTYQPSWSPDSKWLTFGLQDGSVWIIKITGEGLRQLAGSGLNVNPTWSKK